MTLEQSAPDSPSERIIKDQLSEVNSIRRWAPLLVAHMIDFHVATLQCFTQSVSELRRVANLDVAENGTEGDLPLPKSCGDGEAVQAGCDLV